MSLLIFPSLKGHLQAIKVFHETRFSGGAFFVLLPERAHPLGGGAVVKHFVNEVMNCFRFESTFLGFWNPLPRRDVPHLRLGKVVNQGHHNTLGHVQPGISRAHHEDRHPIHMI